jgi:hypothetical protein
VSVKSADFALCDLKLSPAKENAAASELVELVGVVADDGARRAGLLADALFGACFLDTDN